MLWTVVSIEDWCVRIKMLDIDAAINVQESKVSRQLIIDGTKNKRKSNLLKPYNEYSGRNMILHYEVENSVSFKVSNRLQPFKNQEELCDLQKT